MYVQLDKFHDTASYFCLELNLEVNKGLVLLDKFKELKYNCPSTTHIVALMKYYSPLTISTQQECIRPQIPITVQINLAI